MRDELLEASVDVAGTIGCVDASTYRHEPIALADDRGARDRNKAATTMTARLKCRMKRIITSPGPAGQKRRPRHRQHVLRSSELGPRRECRPCDPSR